MDAHATAAGRRITPGPIRRESVKMALKILEEAIRQIMSAAY